MDQKSSMASLLILAVVSWASLLVSPALSLTCSSQKLTAGDKKPFESCLDLPVLDSYLHYTYDASNSSLSIAFVAAPAKPDGWIAWAINPTATGMVGSQALIAFKSNGAPPIVKTYNVSSYSAINEGKLSFDVWNLRAETFNGGKLAIFASVKVPAGAEKLNQVWQIGGKVTNGQPAVHAFDPPNLSSKNELRFAGGADSPSPSPAPTAGDAGSVGKKAAGNAASRCKSTRVNLGIIVLLGSIFIT